VAVSIYHLDPPHAQNVAFAGTVLIRYGPHETYRAQSRHARNDRFHL
jgi:hypothetical protein